MAPTSRATLVRRLTAAVAVLVLVVLALGLLGADRLGLAGPATPAETTSPTGTARPPEDPALEGLDPVLRERVAAAQEAAAAAGHPFHVTSGARTVEEQQRLFDEAVLEHGSVAAASRWVLPPEHSAHVGGLAVDIGPAGAREWLAQHGAEFGLCRVYANEPWHFEPVTEPGGTCPEPVADASWLM